MSTIRRSARFMYVALILALLLGLAVPAQTARAATNVVYDAVPATLPPNMASLGYQATQTSEFGDYVHLAGTYRGLSSVTVTMSTWAIHSTYPTMPSGGWTHPITLNIYNAVPGSPLNTVGSLVATKTQTINIPWRPAEDPVNCPTKDSPGYSYKWQAVPGPADTNCYNGYAFNITFDFSGMGVTLPNDIIIGVAYNTQTYGAAPLGVDGPYNSLNVGVMGTLTAGTDDNIDRVFWNTSTSSWYTDSGAGGWGIFREDTGWGAPWYQGTIPIRIVADDGIYPVTVSSVPANGASLASGPTQLFFTFSEDVVHDGSSVAADNVINYRLFEDGTDNVFDTVDCAGGVDVVNDTNIVINSVSYNAATFTATLNINNGVPLPAGTYRLLVCGTTSIEDLDGYELNDGAADSVLNFIVLAAAPAVPATGFAPGRLTVLPPQAESYAALGDLWLEIPRLGVQMPIVGVPQSADGTWDVSWLGKDAGWLNGSAFPTYSGNSVLTAHVYDAYGNPGPFARVNQMWYGDRVIVHAWGVQYVYEVREVLQVGPGSTAAMMKHQDLPWVTLVTCRGYDATTNSYLSRVLVRAVLVEVK